jgi:hypothetical protein
LNQQGDNSSRLWPFGTWLWRPILAMIRPNLSSMTSLTAQDWTWCENKETAEK